MMSTRRGRQYGRRSGTENEENPRPEWERKMEEMARDHQRAMQEMTATQERRITELMNLIRAQVAP